MFDDPHLRPPVLEEMLPDLNRVIHSAAAKYTDHTSPHLQHDEMVGEGNLKLAQLIDKGVLTDSTKCPTRTAFFNYFKVALTNHLRSRVQKYRFTAKRGGQRQETDGLPDTASSKNVDVSLDDPETSLQVADQHEHRACENAEDIDWRFSAAAEEYAHLLSPMEKLVYRELASPSARTRCFAELDAMRRRTGAPVKVKIKFEHMAQGLGISEDQFNRTVETVRDKIQKHRMATSDEHTQQARISAIIAQLKLLFGLHIPPDLDDMVVRRMLTMAARDQFDKVNADVADMLQAVGAKVPRPVGGGKLACYGVLFQRNNRVCNACDLRHACAVEAANSGLTNMVISPKLLGASQPRVPAFLPRSESDGQSTVRISGTDEAEILAHLGELFKKMERNGKVFYYHEAGSSRTRRLLFCIESTAPFQLRFCAPSDALKKRLTGRQKSWYAPESATYAEIIDLVDQHGKETCLT